MALFPVSSDKIQLLTAAPVSADPYRNGIRWKADGTGVYCATIGGDESQNGLSLTVTGAVVYVDATAGLPANTQFTNGLPISSGGALCISTGSVDEWRNGLPFAANGAVCATVV